MKLTLAGAFNRLAKFSWDTVGQTSAVLTLTAEGQTPITVELKEQTEALVDGVACADFNGKRIRWKATLVAQTAGGEQTSWVEFRPGINKPDTPNCGVPKGEAGDLRPSQGALEEVTVAKFKELVAAKGAGGELKGYRVKNETGLSLTVDNLTIRNCEILAELNTSNHPVTILDSIVNPQKLHVQGKCVVPPEATKNCKLVRCELKGDEDAMNGPSGYAETLEKLGFQVLHCWLHEMTPPVGGHGDAAQLFNVGAKKNGWIGYFFGCRLEGSKSPEAEAGINSAVQLS